MKKTIQRLKNERGLTLVELLAVIVILAIVAIIAFVFIGGVIENSKKDAHIANAQQIISAAKLHEATGGDIPVSAAELKNKDYLDQILDPWVKEDYEIGTVDSPTTGQVTKNNDGEYQITFKDNNSNCDIDETEADLSRKDRDEICDGETGGETGGENDEG